jgi:predicted Zn-dependent protease
VNLPNWVIEGLTRVTPRDRVAPALEALGAASEALADGRYQAAVKHGNRAKALSPQDPTTREIIGIASYRMGDWKTALTELRAFRRMQGDTTHLPVEMDVLRAQGRPADVEVAWKELTKRGGAGLVMNEGAIVYAAFLLDEGRADEAWAVIDPGALKKEPNEGHLRRYYLAARVAAARGDKQRARALSDLIVLTDPSFPGFDELEAEISAMPDPDSRRGRASE